MDIIAKDITIHGYKDLDVAGKGGTGMALDTVII